MKIRTRILLGAGASLFVSAIVLLMVVFILRDMENDAARSRAYQEIGSEIEALNVLISKYPSHPSPSRIRQILEVEGSLNKYFAALTSSEAREASLIRQIRTNSRELGYPLEKLLARSPGLKDEDRYNLIVSQLGMKTQFIADDTRRLLDISQTRMTAARKRAGTLAIGLLAALIVINAAISLFFGRSIFQHQEGLRRALDKAEEGDRLLSALMEHIPMGITIADAPDVTIRAVSRFGRELTGKPGSQLEGIPVNRHVEQWDIYRADGATPATNEELPLTRATQKGEIVRDEVWVLGRGDGSRIPILCTAAPIRDVRGHITGGVIGWQDITERKRAEEALRQRAEEVERLLEAVPAAVWVAHDPQCLAIIGNRRANEFYEAQAGENVSATTLPEARRFFTPDGRELPAEELPMQKAVATNQSVLDTELHVELPSGRWIVMLGSAVPLRDPQGNARGCIGAFMDITARKKTEEALRESEAKYRNLFENMMEEVHFWQLIRDETGQIRTWRLVDANPPTIKTWGRTSLDEIKGKTTDEIFGPGSTDHYMPVVRKIMTEGVPYSFEDYFPHLDKYFRFTSVPLGEYFITTGADITAIKKAELALRESEERFRVMADTMPQLVWLAGADGYLYWYNRRWYEYTGTTPEQMEGWGWQSVHDPDVLPGVLERWKASIATGEPFDMTFPLRGADGNYRQFLTRGLPVRNAEGELIQWCGTNTDITERKLMEEELRRSRGELELRIEERTVELRKYMTNLEQSNQALQDFASIASHDLQEPLRKIRTFGDRLRDTCGPNLGELGNDYLRRVLNASERMQSLLMALLHYSRVTAKAEPFTDVELDQVVRAVLSDLEARIEQTDGRVEVGYLPVIRADASQMHQVMQNLIGNGLKYHGEEKPSVKVSAETFDSVIRIYVEDNGIGFDEKHLDKIFQPFQRLHGKNSQYEGTGIGLAICKKIVERHGGSITAKSTPGKGATFIVTLPVNHA